MDYISLMEKPDLKMDLKILNITCHTGDVLVKFQGKYISDSEFDYHILQKELQLVPKVFKDLDIGEFCLVQDKPYGVWHRGKICDKVKQTFEVALIDQGNVIKVLFSQIAVATGELFTLPPKVVNGIFSNLLPLEQKWTSRAVNYFLSLVGEQLHGHVQIFLPHQVILLEVSKVINHAIEFNVAKYVDSDSFCLLVELLHKVPANSHCKQMPDLLQQKKQSDNSLSLKENLPRFQKILDHLRPVISDGTIEKIKISAAVSPDRFYCHILSWEVELNKLSASMSSHYENVNTEDSSTLGSFGVLCAAKRKDGLWCRGIIQTLVSCNEVKVWFFDIGSSETVSSSCVQKLQPEFLFLPMMAIPCALSQTNGHIESVKHMQLGLFKEALMGHVVIAHIDNFCSDERLFFISLYDKEYELNSDCHLTNIQVPIFSPNAYTGIIKSEYYVKKQETKLPETLKLEPEEKNSYISIQMDLDSVHTAYVEYVLNPSNFWIRIDECQNEFLNMMTEMAEQYNKCELTEMVLQDPKPGQLCCALYEKDRHYYRAVISDVFYPQISVYFIDFGNTETVPFYDVKVILPQFSALPALAICCTLAHVYPVEDVWVKAANDYFKQTVAGKALLCHVLAKQKYKYVVELRLLENSETSDIVTLLVQAGHAEFWEINLHSIPECSSSEIGTKYKKNVGERKTKNNKKAAVATRTIKPMKTEPMSSLCAPHNSLLMPSVAPFCYKQYMFKPGTRIDVKCCHVQSPRNFWCQLSANLCKLTELMDEMQRFYTSTRRLYHTGQVACVVRSSITGKYYRAAIVKHVSKKEVDVIFVDYGYSEKVLLSEVKEMEPRFLTLEGQAFRCCLSKVFSPSYTHHDWSVNACEEFKTFVNSASGVIKCTVIAVFSNESEDLCNAVNLETQFANANQLLASKGHLVLPETVPSVHLHTFCYSCFDLEVGSKENMYVAFVYNTGRFYCHLAKNDKIFEMLVKKANKIGEQIKPDTMTKLKELCIVRYNEDGNFYRALACPMQSSSSLFLAHFVDFGDSQVVKKRELLPIPEDETDILFQPMQAIPCYFSGLKETAFTTKAKTWFEEHCMGKLTKAVVVSKDNEGLLELDLYYEDIHVNKAVKELMGLPYTQEKTIKPSVKNSDTSCDADTVEAQRRNEESDYHWGGNTGKAVHLSEFNANEIPFKQVTSCYDHSKNLQETTSFDSAQTSSEDIHVITTSLSPTNQGRLVKCIDLPQASQEVGQNDLVYVSHVNTPSNFYLHLAKNETQIIQLADDLNNMSFQTIDVKDFEQGVLVVAQYPNDKLFYRGEIKEILKGNLFEVEFIDYGNAARLSSSCIFMLPEKFLAIPRLSISVSLTGVQKLQNCGQFCKSVMDKFSEKVSNEPVYCEFIARNGKQWEVNIICKGQSVSEELLQNFLSPSKPLTTVVKRDIPSKSELSYFHVSSKSVREEVIVTPTDNIQEFTCLKLKSGQIESVKHVYISNSGLVFVNLANFSEEHKINTQISFAVKQTYNRLVAKEITVGMPCLAKSEKMQAWFRATIEGFFKSTMKIRVFFVDHGAHEIISVHNAKSITAADMLIPKQAVACTWVGISSMGAKTFKTQMQTIVLKKMQVILLEFLESIKAWKVEIVVNGSLLTEYFNRTTHKSGNEWSSAEPSCSFETEMCFPVQRALLKPLRIYHGFVSLFQDPSSFFIELGDSFDTMIKLLQLMQKLPEELLPLSVKSVKPGFSCLIKCFAEREWCRAEIVSITMDSILLYLLDYGTYKTILYSDFGNLKEISKELHCLPALTYHCKLHGVIPVDGKCWSKEAISFCIRFVSNQELVILPINDPVRNITEVSVYGQGDLGHKLVSNGLALNSEEQRGKYEYVTEPRSDQKLYFSKQIKLKQGAISPLDEINLQLK